MNTQGFSLHRGRDKVFFLGWYFKKKRNSHHNKQKINYAVNLFFLKVQSNKRKCSHRLCRSVLGGFQKKVGSEHNLYISCELPVQVNVKLKVFA